MRRLISILILTAGLAQAQTYVLPTRTDLNITDWRYSLPFSTYTNTTAWLIGRGTATNLYDFSPAKSNAHYVNSNALDFNGSSAFGSIPFSDSMFGQLPYAQTPDVEAYQGVAMSETHMYTAGGDKTTAVISKRLKDSPYTIITTNTDPFGAISTVNHINDICIFGDTLYAAICYRLDENNYSDPLIVGYDKDTLVQTVILDLSAFALSTTAVTHDGTDLFVMELGQNNPATFNEVHKMTTAGALIETITLSPPLPNGAEGITIFEDEIYASARPDGVLVYDMDGTYQRKCLFDTFTKSATGKFTGIDFTTDDKVIGITTGFPDGQVMFLDGDQLQVSGWGFECEFIPDDRTTAQGLVTSWRFDNNERIANLQISGNTIRFIIGDEEGTASSDIITTPSVVGLNSVDAWYDTEARTINIQNNGGSVESAAYAGVFSIAENPIILGDSAVPTSHIWYNGKMSVVRHYNIIDGEKVYGVVPSMAVGVGDAAMGKAGTGDSAGLTDTAWITADVRASNTIDGFSKATYFNTSLTSYATSSNSTDYANQDWSVPFTFMTPPDFTITRVVFSQQDGTGTGRNWAYFSNTEDTLSTVLSGTQVQLNSGSLLSNTWYECILDHDATANTVTLTLDGVQKTPASVVAQSATGDFILGSTKIYTSQLDSFIGSITLPNGDTLADVVETDTGSGYVPATVGGIDDVAGLGLTNIGGVYAHNNSEVSIVINGVTNSFDNLLTNATYNASVDASGLITEVYEEN